MVGPNDVPAVQWAREFIQLAGLVALIVYVWKTWQMASATRDAAQAAAASVEEGRETRREASAPRLDIYFANPEGTLAEIVIENFGDSTATDIRLKFEPPLTSSTGDTAVRFFDSPKTIQPRSKLVHAFDSWPTYFEKRCPRQYEVQIEFRRLDEVTPLRQRCVLDAGMFEHQHSWRRKGIGDIAITLEKLQKEVAKISSDLGKRSEMAWAVSQITPGYRTLPQAIAAVYALLDLMVATKNSDVSLPLLAVVHALRPAALNAWVAAQNTESGEPFRLPLLELLRAAHHRHWLFLDSRAAHAALTAAISTLDSLRSAAELLVKREPSKITLEHEAAFDR